MVASAALTVLGALAGIMLLNAAVAQGSLWFGAAVAVAVFALPVVLSHPWLALVLVVSVELSNFSEVLNLYGLPGVTSLTLLLAVGAIVVGLLRGTVRLAWSPVFLFALVFLATRSLSLPVSLEPAEGVTAIADAAKGLATLVLATTLMSSTRRFKSLVMIAVAILAGTSALTVINQYVLHNATSLGGLSNVPLVGELGAATARHAGPESDVNYWARNLLLYVPCALSLWAAGAGRRRSTWPWAVATVALAWGVYLTQSRGGMIALVVGVAAWLLLVRPFSARKLLLAPVLVAGLLLVVPGFASRLATLSSLDVAQSGAGDTSLVGRLAVQEAGWNMFRDHPSTGVGPGNFSEVLPDYERLTVLSGPKILAPHNLYLQMGAEGGAAGLAGWMLFFGSGVFVTARARLISRYAEPSDLPSGTFLISSAVLAGMISWAIAGLFLQIGDFAVLLVVMAIGAGLDIRARDVLRDRPSSSIDAGRRTGFAEATGPDAGPGRRPISAGLRDRPTGPWLLATTVFVLAVTAGLLVVPVHRSLWSATSSAALTPENTGAPAASSYEYDLLSRRSLLTTFEVLVENPRFADEAQERLSLTEDDVSDLTTSVSASATSAVITLEVRGPPRSVVEAMAPVTVEQASRYLGAVQDDYALRATGAGQTTIRQVKVLEPGRVAVVVGVSLVIASLAQQVFKRRTRRRESVSTISEPTVACP